MKKADQEDNLRSEYRRTELGKGVRGRYYDAYKSGHNLVLLKPEVAKAFPNEQSVNEALMSLIKVAQKVVGPAN